MGLAPWDYTNAITGEGPDVRDSVDVDKEMPVWIVRRGLLPRPDAIDALCIVNEMGNVSALGTYLVLRALVPKRRARYKWPKEIAAPELVAEVMDIFGLGRVEAEEVVFAIGEDGVRKLSESAGDRGRDSKKGKK